MDLCSLLARCSIVSDRFWPVRNRRSGRRTKNSQVRPSHKSPGANTIRCHRRPSTRFLFGMRGWQGRTNDHTYIYKKKTNYFFSSDPLIDRRAMWVIRSTATVTIYCYIIVIPENRRNPLKKKFKFPRTKSTSYNRLFDRRPESPDLRFRLLSTASKPFGQTVRRRHRQNLI